MITLEKQATFAMVSIDFSVSGSQWNFLLIIFDKIQVTFYSAFTIEKVHFLLNRIICIKRIKKKLGSTTSLNCEPTFNHSQALSLGSEEFSNLISPARLSVKIANYCQFHRLVCRCFKKKARPRLIAVHWNWRGYLG